MSEHDFGIVKDIVVDFTVSDALCKKWVNIELIVIDELDAFPLLGHEPWIHSK